jgi:hypothetical protein
MQVHQVLDVWWWRTQLQNLLDVTANEVQVKQFEFEHKNFFGMELCLSKLKKKTLRNLWYFCVCNYKDQETKCASVVSNRHTLTTIFCVFVCKCVLPTATGISGHFSTTLTERFPCFFLSCKANSMVWLPKMGHDLALSNIFYCYVCSFICILCTVCV